MPLQDVQSPFQFGRSADQEEELLDKIYQALSGTIGNNTSTNVMNQQQIPGPFLHGPYSTRKAELLDKILQAAINIGGGNPNNRITVLPNGTAQTVINAGQTLEFIQFKEAAGIANLLIGTTPGGNELYEGEIQAAQWQTITLFEPFEAQTTIYFTNITVNTQIKIYKQ